MTPLEFELEIMLLRRETSKTKGKHQADDTRRYPACALPSNAASPGSRAMGMPSIIKGYAYYCGAPRPRSSVLPY
jgi:hypothetical protein